MAYLHTSADKAGMGWLGCGQCGCAGCRGPARRHAGLGERYVRDDDEEEEEVAPPAAARDRGPRVQRVAPLTGFGRFGEQGRLQIARRPGIMGPRLRMPPFTTITGFAPGSASLSGAQLATLAGVASFIARSWQGTAPITSVRLAGFIDGREANATIGNRRARAVRDALVGALARSNPGLSARIRWLTEDRGLAPAASVEVYLWAGPTAPPVPPPARVPSPAEVAQRIEPSAPETVDARIQRILRALPPSPPSRTYSQAIWRRVDERLNRTLSRLPSSLRGPIRRGVHEALRRGSKALLDRVLDASGASGEVKEAILETIRAAGGLPGR